MRVCGVDIPVSNCSDRDSGDCQRHVGEAIKPGNGVVHGELSWEEVRAEVERAEGCKRQGWGARHQPVG